MKFNFSAFGSFHLLLFVLVLELLPDAQSKWTDVFRGKKDPNDGRKLVEGRGGDLMIEAGDTVVTSLAPSKRYLKAPFRWFYAVNNKGIVIHFLPRIHKLFSNVQPVLIDVPLKYKETKVMNRGKKPGHIGKVGSLIAALMFESSKQQQQKFHFNLFWCNCKHYTEYLSLGRVKGSYLKAMYQPMDKKCPLYANLSAGMYDEIYKSKKFVLHDKKGSVVHLKVDEWPDYV